MIKNLQLCLVLLWEHTTLMQTPGQQGGGCAEPQEEGDKGGSVLPPGGPPRGREGREDATDRRRMSTQG